MNSVPDALRENPHAIGTDSWHQWIYDLLKASRGPLIESPQAHVSNVTFVYVADPGVRRVALFTALTDQGPYGMPMMRIHGTRVFWICVQADDDISTSYQFGLEVEPVTRNAFFALSDTDRLALLEARADLLRADPANPDVIRPTATDPTADLPFDRWASILSMPRCRRAPWTTKRAGAPSGSLAEFTFRGTSSRDERTVWIYRPPVGPAPSRLLVLLDGGIWQNIVPVSTILDNLATDRQIAPLSAVFVGHPPPPGRDVEYRCSDTFANLLADELVPWAAGLGGASGCPVTIGGLGRGGLAAVHTALTRSDVFSQSIALSGSFWWSPPHDPAPEWLTRTIATRPLRPAAFFLAAGRLERQRSEAHHGKTMLETHRHLADTLTRRGHLVRYDIFPGGHEATPHRAVLADALNWLCAPGGPQEAAPFDKEN